MNTLAFFLLFGLAQDSFIRFSYCHDRSQGPLETQCVQIGRDGTGEFRQKRRDGNDLRAELAMSPSARDQFLALLSRTNYLANGAKYESGRKVADLGLKRLSIELPSGRREATFNFSTIKEVGELSAFLESLIARESLVLEIEATLEYNRLQIPALLERIEQDLKSNRVGDPVGLVPALAKVQNDRRVLEYARTHAGKIQEKLRK